MKAPNFILKIIPHVDGSPADLRAGALPSRGHHLEGSLDRPRSARPVPARARDVARLPVREVVSALHFKADLTLGLGTVAFDYMKKVDAVIPGRA